MSKPSDNPADPFKKALAEATKTLADAPEMTVSFTVDPAGVSGDQMRLPQVSRRMTRDEILLARGTGDALALRQRHHDAAVGARGARTQRPRLVDARALAVAIDAAGTDVDDGAW